MFSKSADLYDLIYSQFKDYRAEAQKLRDLIERERPSAKTILDIACGTGEHARILEEDHGFSVSGIDLDAGLVSLAQQKNPTGRFKCADMTDFDLRESFDVVMCLFSSIGYLKTLSRVTQALSQFKKHMKDGGFILLEPWFRPEAFTQGRVFLNTASANGIEVVRMGTSEVKGRVSTLIFHYLIGTEGEITHEVEKHELGLFTVGEMKQCFADVGMRVKYEDEGIAGRGLYIARKG